MGTGRVWTTDEGREFYGVAPDGELTFERVLSLSTPTIASGFTTPCNRLIGAAKICTLNSASCVPTGASDGPLPEGAFTPARPGNRTG